MKKLSILLGLNVLLLAMVRVAQVPGVFAVILGESGWVTAGGTIGVGDELDYFGGCATTMKSAAIRGQWLHVDPYGQNIFEGEVHYLILKKFPSLNGPGLPNTYPNYANFGGMGTFNGVSGYYFDVKVFDHSNVGAFHDRYTIDVYSPTKELVFHADGKASGTCLEDPTVTPDLEWVKEFGCLSGGNIVIHPPNGGHPYYPL